MTCGGDWHCRRTPPSSQASPIGSVTCGGDWHCRCVPPTSAGDSENDSTLVLLPSKTWSLRCVPPTVGSEPLLAFLYRGRINRSTCKGFRRKLSSDHVWASDKISFLKASLKNPSSCLSWIDPLKCSSSSRLKQKPNQASAWLTKITFRSYCASRMVVLAFRLCFCGFTTFRFGARAF